MSVELQHQWLLETREKIHALQKQIQEVDRRRFAGKHDEAGIAQLLKDRQDLENQIAPLLAGERLLRTRLQPPPPRYFVVDKSIPPEVLLKASR